MSHRGSYRSPKLTSIECRRAFMFKIVQQRIELVDLATDVAPVIRVVGSVVGRRIFIFRCFVHFVSLKKLWKFIFRGIEGMQNVSVPVMSKEIFLLRYQAWLQKNLNFVRKL